MVRPDRRSRMDPSRVSEPVRSKWVGTRRDPDRGRGDIEYEEHENVVHSTIARLRHCDAHGISARRIVFTENAIRKPRPSKAGMKPTNRIQSPRARQCGVSAWLNTVTGPTYPDGAASPSRERRTRRPPGICADISAFAPTAAWANASPLPHTEDHQEIGVPSRDGDTEDRQPQRDAQGMRKRRVPPQGPGHPEH